MGRLPGNLVYKGQLLERRGTDVVEALGVGYFFSTYDQLGTLRPPRNPPLPGNLVYKGQLLEKRGPGVVEALGVGYFAQHVVYDKAAGRGTAGLNGEVDS